MPLVILHHLLNVFALLSVSLSTLYTSCVAELHNLPSYNHIDSMETESLGFNHRQVF
jgi:hypothetical protein